MNNSEKLFHTLTKMAPSNATRRTFPGAEQIIWNIGVNTHSVSIFNDPTVEKFYKEISKNDNSVVWVENVRISST